MTTITGMPASPVPSGRNTGNVASGGGTPLFLRLLLTAPRPASRRPPVPSRPPPSRRKIACLRCTSRRTLSGTKRANDLPLHAGRDRRGRARRLESPGPAPPFTRLAAPADWRSLSATALLRPRHRCPPRFTFVVTSNGALKPSLPAGSSPSCWKLLDERARLVEPFVPMPRPSRAGSASTPRRTGCASRPFGRPTARAPRPTW